MASFEVYIAESGSYVVCKVIGNITGEDALAFSVALHNLCQESGLQKVLVDVRKARNVASASENYSYAHHELAKVKFSREIKSATLVSTDDSSHKFVETVAQNAGYRVKYFDDEADAIAWLDYSDDGV